MKTFILFFLYSLITEGVFGESVSVKEGDSVTLHTGLSEIQTNDVIDWRFGGQRIARMKKGSEPSKTDDALDGKFRGRLKLDGQTGDLTITNFRNTDSGEYKVSNSTDTLNVLFTVTVVSVDVTLVSVLEGDTVTLHTDPTEIQGDDVIQWRFGQQKSLVAEMNRDAGIFNTYDGPDGRFRDRLKLDQSGSLIIIDTRITDSGLYEVEISSSRSRYTRHYTQSFRVTVRDDVEKVSVMKGDNVPLRTGLTGTQRIEQIRWTFGDDEVIAYLNGPVNKDNFGLNNQTGDLTIRNIQTDQYGDYKVEINTRTMIFHRKYQITVVDVPDSGRSSAAVAGIFVGGVGVGLLLAAGVIYYCYKKYKTRNQSGTTNRGRPNRALNGTQDTSDRVNEGTELTNAS